MVWLIRWKCVFVLNKRKIYQFSSRSAHEHGEATGCFSVKSALVYYYHILY